MNAIEALKPRTPALALAIALVLPAGVSAQQPRIDLFSEAIKEEVAQETRESTEAYNAMLEDDRMLSAEIRRLKESYEASACGTANPTRGSGCAEIKTQLADAMLKVMEFVSEQIPNILVPMEKTVDTLGKIIRRELGRKRTPGELEGLLQGAGIESDRETTTRRRSGMKKGSLTRMPEVFAKMTTALSAEQTPDAVRYSTMYLDNLEGVESFRKVQMDLNNIKTALKAEKAKAVFSNDGLFDDVGSILAILLGDQADPTPIIPARSKESPPTPASRFKQCELDLSC